VAASLAANCNLAAVYDGTTGQPLLVNPLPGKPPVYRVQVGRFQERAEADRIASRLQKEEQFSPWVTR